MHMGNYFKFDVSYDERDMKIIEWLVALGYKEDTVTEGRFAYKPEGSAKELGSIFINMWSDNVSVTNHRGWIKNESVNKDEFILAINEEIEKRA